MGGWVEWIEENEAVRMRCYMCCRWVGGWVGEGGRSYLSKAVTVVGQGGVSPQQGLHHFHAPLCGLVGGWMGG